MAEAEYGPGKDIPLAEIAQEVAAKLEIPLEVMSEQTVEFIGWDRVMEEETTVLISSVGDSIDVDFDAEGSTGGVQHFPTRELATAMVHILMRQYGPRRQDVQ